MVIKTLELRCNRCGSDKVHRRELQIVCDDCHYIGDLQESISLILNPDNVRNCPERG